MRIAREPRTTPPTRCRRRPPLTPAHSAPLRKTPMPTKTKAVRKAALMILATVNRGMPVQCETASLRLLTCRRMALAFGGFLNLHMSVRLPAAGRSSLIRASASPTAAFAIRAIGPSRLLGSSRTVESSVRQLWSSTLGSMKLLWTGMQTGMSSPTTEPLLDSESRSPALTRGTARDRHSSEHSATRACRARLRAVAASTSAQQGRHPAGELTASTAQLDTLSVSHAVARRVQALAQYNRQPANQPEGLAGAVQPPVAVALEVASRAAVLRRILASDPGASPVESDNGRVQLHDLESVAVSGPDPYTAPSNGADRVPETHRHSPDSGQCQAPLGGALCAPALPPLLLLTLTTPEVTTAPEVVWGSDPTPQIRGPLTQASASPESEGEPPFRRVHLGRKGEMGSINSRKSQLGRGVRLLGFWALGRHAVPSICTRT
eukprot:scaffold14713_cov131-Isochrysis_galbana.AAC.4